LIKTYTKEEGTEERYVEPPIRPLTLCQSHAFAMHCVRLLIVRWLLHLARSRAGDVGAAGGLLATGDGVAGPGPAGAGTGGTEDVDVGGGAGDGTGVLAHGQAGNWDTVGRLAGRGAVLIVLLNDNTARRELATSRRHGQWRSYYFLMPERVLPE